MEEGTEIFFMKNIKKACCPIEVTKEGNITNEIISTLRNCKWNDCIKYIKNKVFIAIITIDSPEIANESLIRQGIKSLQLMSEKLVNQKFVELRGLNDILDAFKSVSNNFIPYKFAFDGTPVVKLDDNELWILRKFSEILEKM